MNRITLTFMFVFLTIAYAIANTHQEKPPIKIPIEIPSTNNPTKPHRSSNKSLIYATIDYMDNTTIKVSTEESTIGEIYLYDENEAIVDYATTINGAILSIPTPSIYTIVIQNENWYATGIISF